MDRITRSLLNAFVSEESLNPKDDSEAFEHFCNYCVLSKEYSDDFNITDVAVDGANDLGLDGIGVIVNGCLVTSKVEVEDLCAANRLLDVTFIFTQAKTSSNFDTSEFGQFTFGVKDFFSESPKLPKNDRIKAYSEVSEYIFTQGGLMTRGKPVCKLYYVTTGKWQKDPAFCGRMEAEKADLQKTNLFRQVEIIPVDADGIQRLYNNTKNKIQAEITFTNKTALPDIVGVKEAYLGILPAKEYLRLIVDDSGAIRRNLFYDNVRDFQGDNEVNKEIGETLIGPHQNQFVILNNGITIIAKTLRSIGNRLTIEDYQVVNGCQTSHVLFAHKDALQENTFVPVKIIAIDDEDVTNSVIKATNRQTSVANEDLEALSDFQKKLESYYDTFDLPKKLYYERRPGQYNGVPGIEKVRIVSIRLQIRCFASMFLDEPHRAGRYYGTLLKLIGNKIFLSTHDPISYYTNGFANYRLESLFRNGSLDTKYRLFKNHLLMILKYKIGGKEVPALTANKMKTYCQKILEVLWDGQASSAAFNVAASEIDAVITGGEDRDSIKTQGFTDRVLARVKV